MTDYSAWQIVGLTYASGFIPWLTYLVFFSVLVVPFTVVRSIFLYYTDYYKAIQYGSSVPEYRYRGLDITHAYFSRCTSDGSDRVWLWFYYFLLSVIWPITFAVGVFGGVHNLIIWAMKKKLEAAVLLHPDDEVRNG